MTEILAFIGAHPLITFALVILLVLCPLHYAVFLTRSLLVQRTISKHGYPPAHCDAEGDTRNTETND